MIWTTGRERELHPGARKNSKLEFRDKVEGLGGGARCEDVEGPCSALLPRERNSEGEKNETFVRT